MADQTLPKPAGFLLLLLAICLNTAGLIGLRLFSGSGAEGLLILGLGYVPLSLGLLCSRERLQVSSTSMSAKSVWAYLWIWALSVTCIYTVFLFFPNAISVSQLVIAQCLTPLLVVLVTADLSSGEKRAEFLKRMVPLGLLIALAGFRHTEGQFFQTFLAFSMICLAFFATQSSMRQLARLQQPGWVLPRFGTLAMAICFVMASLTAGYPFEPEVSKILLFASAAGIVLLGIKGGYLVGLANASPMVTKITLSLFVPLALGAEWFIFHKAISPTEIGLAAAYCLSHLFLTNQRRTKPQLRIITSENHQIKSVDEAEEKKAA